SVKLKLASPETLPATSVCLTCTAFGPSAAAKLGDQVAPPSALYSTSAPASTPLSASVPSLVTRSGAELPVSLESATPGAACAVVSSVKEKLAAGPVLPATSVCLTLTELSPSAAAKLDDQFAPPSALYSTVAPASTPLSARLPSL